MKIRVQPPSAQDATELKIASDAIEFSPIAVKGVSTVRACYVVAIGDGGAEAKALVLFNARNGQFSIQQVDETASPVKLDFDRPKVDFEKRRESKKQEGKKLAGTQTAPTTASKS